MGHWQGCEDDADPLRTGKQSTVPGPWGLCDSMLHHPLTGCPPTPLVLALCLISSILLLSFPCLPSFRPSQTFLFLSLRWNPGQGLHPDPHLDPDLKWSPGQAAGASGRLRASPKIYCCSDERNERGNTEAERLKEGPSERKHGPQPLHSKKPGHWDSGLELTHLLFLTSWHQQGLWPGCTQYGSCPVYGPPFFPFQSMGMGWEPEAVVPSFLLTHHGFCQ